MKKSHPRPSLLCHFESELIFDDLDEVQTEEVNLDLFQLFSMNFYLLFSYIQTKLDNHYEF